MRHELPPEQGPFIIVMDEDGHDYVIPESRRDEFDAWVYFEQYDADTDQWARPPEQPEWCWSLPGSPSNFVHITAGYIE